MPSASYNKFNLFTDDLCQAKHNFSSDTIKILLTDVAPVATDHVTSDITEISAGNGYNAGGTQTTITLSNSSGVESVNGSTVVFTASGGNIGPFRYAVLNNSTASLLIAWWDYGGEVTLNSGETFTAAPTSGNLFKVT